MPFFRKEHRVFQPELHIVQDEPVTGIELRHLRAEMVVRILRPALRLRAVIDDDLVGVELKALARHIVGADLAVRPFHRARMFLIVVVDVIAVERHARRPLRQLQHVCAIRHGHVAAHRIARHIVSLKAARLQLDNIHMSLRRKVPRTLIVRQVIALKRDRRGLIRRHGMAQMLLHRRDIGKQLLLLRREPIGALRTPLILDIIQALDPGIRVRAVRRVHRPRQKRTGGGQGEQNTGGVGCTHRRVLLLFKSNLTFLYYIINGIFATEKSARALLVPKETP